MDGSSFRLEPPSVDFRNISLRQTYKVTVKATNVAKTIKTIYIDRPTTKLFKFTAAGKSTVVAPGLSVSGVLQFTPEKEEEVRDCLLVRIDETEIIKVPLLGLPRSCSLLTDSILDFGDVAASSQIITKHHFITNNGSAAGAFQVQYSGDASIRLSPLSGVIDPGATQSLTVELRTDRPRQIDEKALIKMQDRSPTALIIRAGVVDQRLEATDLKGNPLSCLWFGPVYFGTSKVKRVVLRNNGPQACDWVCVHQETAAGTEIGTNFRKSTAAALLERMKLCCSASQDISQVLVWRPHQGRLDPYETVTVTVRFSPVCNRTSKRLRDLSGSRHDYCLFLLFDSVESKHGFTHPCGKCSVELAVTGTGLPVNLVISPSDKLDFPPCVKGQSADQFCVLRNLCTQLPVNFHFRKVAHFTSEPSKGTIGPGQSQAVVLSFTARQHGSFQVCQTLDVVGHVQPKSDNTAVTELELGSVHTVALQLFAICGDETGKSTFKRNTDMRSIDKEECKGLISSHRLRRAKAFTDIYFRQPLGPQYTLNAEERELRQRNRQVFLDLIDQWRQTRLTRIENKRLDKAVREVDIGIVPCQGLAPTVPNFRDLVRNDTSKAKLKSKSAPAQFKGARSEGMICITQQKRSQASEAMDAVPCNSQQVAECSKTLTQQEYYKVVVAPSFVNFGEVCVNSTSFHKLELINRLPVHVWVQLEIDCVELQGSSPLSHILPPFSWNTLPLTFQSSKPGEFSRSVSYTVNQQHLGQILVQAQVMPLTLELSTTLLALRPTPTALAQSAYRGSVTLRNLGNHPAEFKWRPVVTESGILFSVRPATGVVEPHKELDCEVVWYPSYSSPSEGVFDLCVREGITQRLHCVAKLGSTSVQPAEKQLTLGSVPLNVTSDRTAVLHNTGQNHAYYQVLDESPLPGLVVSPCEGVVPSQGHATLKIHFRPDSLIRFDTRVRVALRGMKPIELRMGGSVEPPNVHINVSHFQFHGVHIGSQREIPFTLTNHSLAMAQVIFNLTQYPDFSLQLPQPSHEIEAGLSIMEVQSQEMKKCSLILSPTQATNYDFNLPLWVNGIRWPIPSWSPPPVLPSKSTASSSSSSSSSPSSPSAVNWKHTALPFSRSVTMATQWSLHIQATVLHALLEMSPSTLQFHVQPLSPESDVYTKIVELKAAHVDSLCWCGVINERIHWSFDCDAIAALAESNREGELCTVTPSSGCLRPSQSVRVSVSIRPEAIRTASEKLIKLCLPLYLGDKANGRISGEMESLHYRELTVVITVVLPSITFHPPQLLLTPAPLKSQTTAKLTLLAVGYPSETRISAEVDDVELDNGTKFQPVSIIFPEGDCIPAHNKDQNAPGIQSQETKMASLVCNVSFLSPIPLSLCTYVTFTEHHFNNRFKVKLCAIADNCLLTVWPYMALHGSEQQIVLKKGAKSVEAILQRCQTPSPPSVPESSSSSFISLTNKNLTSSSDSSNVSDQTSRDDVSPNRPDNPGLPDFPDSDSDNGVYHHKVVLAVERWFSLFGWADGPHPISVPQSIRKVEFKTLKGHSSGRTYRVSQNKDSRSIIDMLRHMSMKVIPGIPRCMSFSTEKEKRTHQLMRQYKAMLAFLRVQGASLWHIRPEYLLDVEEFKYWCSLQSNKEECGFDYSSVNFEPLSKRSWTDVLLQIYKVFVTCHVMENGLSQDCAAGTNNVNIKPMTSNVYSACELHLLSWLNGHYEDMRTTIWSMGNIPSARWIVNFDLDLTDGLVFASLLAAYCPYLIGSHLQRMYPTPSSLEQILHNNIIVVRALTLLSINIDVQPTDLSDPNPVQMLMLCVHLYERLPQYLPLTTITLSGSLHSTFSKQVRLKNPASIPVKYQVLILGEDARFFSVAGGSIITIHPQIRSDLSVQYQCSFLQSMEAVLLLITSPAFGLSATTLAFKLRTHISNIKPTKTVKCTSPCFELSVVQMPIKNPFSEEANFRVVLVESTFNPLNPEKKKQSSPKAKINKRTSDINCVDDGKVNLSAFHVEDREFLSAVTSVCLKPGQTDTLNLHYLPFTPGPKYCSVLLVCPLVGDMVYIVKATGELPLPSPLNARPSSNIVLTPGESVLRLYCKVDQMCEEVVRVPLINMALEKALAIWCQQRMTPEEHRRRTLTQTLYSTTVRSTAALHKLFNQQALRFNGVLLCKVAEYTVEASLPQYVTVPSTIEIPVREDTNIPWEEQTECGYVDIPIRFQADCVGKFTFKIILKSSCDIRVYMIEAVVTSQGESTHLEFSSPVHYSVTQKLQITNETNQDWNIHAEISGEGFCGPKVLNVPTRTMVSYPLSFHPSSQSTVMGRLCLHNDYNGTEQVFILRGVGERPLPVDSSLSHLPIERITETHPDVSKYS